MCDVARAARLARIALAFGRVERATRHEDGVRPETDTDHTVMLSLVACEFAPPGLDRAKVAAFALVHDLVEVYAGDAQTLTITPEGMAAKRAREDAARSRLTAELGAGSWLAAMLAIYEEQRVPEARFVRLIDKVLPKLAHAFNGCAAAAALTDHTGFVDSHARQFQEFSEKYPEFPETLALLRASMLRAEECWPAAPREGDDRA
jgi:putative hydrolase of HD superfamily